ncbi:GH36-type glycosyl hydrolase domain-containing protein [Paenibacillus sp. B01]|uniref:GH36-type glycosyl hydrolase domain-containing protein n=1 Tax=Paenibacillus sp. B01 TaxID=2660554 RepID=UPI00129AAF00|nr:cellobiose phosphorylase [Paenibacillus sp. B01]QGG57483.1 cellobiose phosphorylase [Paenibacillus sp. B01]
MRSQSKPLPSASWRLERDGLAFTFHPTGDLYEASGSGMMLNQLRSHPLDGSLNQLYLRVRGPEGMRAYPLIGIRSDSRVGRGRDRIVWSGEAAGVRYEAAFRLGSGGAWFWSVRLEADERGRSADIVYGQDIGLGAPGAVRGNEAYNAHYLDHSAYEDEHRGWIVCTRQNQPQDGRFPYAQQGCLTGAVSFATDGFAFFGRSFKETHQPEALKLDRLPGEVLQYEFAYTALQSREVDPADGAEIVFYGLFRDDHPEAVERAEFGEEIERAWTELCREENEAVPTQPTPRRADDLGEPLQARSLSEQEIAALYPLRIEEERRDGELHAFFTPEYAHVALKAKELLLERPHGHILLSGAPDMPGAEVLATTAYMYGIFHSQLVVGNTSFNKLIGHARSALNAAHASGLRLYAEQDGRFRLLAMPSLFEMGFNYARWVYALDGDTVTVTSWTSADAPEATLDIASAAGISRRYLLTAQITMGERELEGPYRLEAPADGSLRFRAAAGSPIAGAYPELAYRLTVAGTGFERFDDRRLVPDLEPGVSPLLVLQTEASASWSVRIEGRLDGLPAAAAPAPELPQSAAAYRAGMAELMRGFRLEHPGGDPSVRRLDLLSWWYVHNMRVHFLSPHGLEQYGGAAWGTRDVCQGPAEFFLAMQRWDAVRGILRTVYEHQYEQSGGWPQWFMFDRYSRIQQHESHGDIVVWPLKLLGDYLSATGDYGLLDEKLPYTDETTFDFTAGRHPLREHVERQLAHIRDRFLPGTMLSAYGDGDWDDTLQPARPELRASMASSWTVALTYQAMRTLGRALASAPGHASWSEELLALADGIRRDFAAYMDPDGVIPGFLDLADPARPAKLLHPDDVRTGIRYRLLPMTRSMIAELLTPEQAEAHRELIRRELRFPDGVRLMNRPAAYEGGVSVRFKRAEQAANFGREIGLQYVHAHIRYIEAMAKLGQSEEAWHALQVISPVGIEEAVPNAAPRQSNAYFSSSDGAFANRREAAARFEELRSGAAPVKGGWRIYSSGPGIYLNQLVSSVLGIRAAAGRIVLDPALPASLDGLSVRFELAGRPVRIVYRLSGSPVSRISVNGREAAFARLPHPYRSGGAELSLDELEPLWNDESGALQDILVEA